MGEAAWIGSPGFFDGVATDGADGTGSLMVDVLRGVPADPGVAVVVVVFVEEPVAPGLGVLDRVE